MSFVLGTFVGVCNYRMGCQYDILCVGYRLSVAILFDLIAPWTELVIHGTIGRIACSGASVGERKWLAFGAGYSRECRVLCGNLSGICADCKRKGIKLPSTEAMTRVKTVIRICLQLDAEAAIPDDMPLMEGEFDIDSLDVLLIVTELERAFDVDITDGEMERTDLMTVASLSSFMEALCSTSLAKEHGGS